MVQEALLRYHREVSADRRIDSPLAFIATVAARLAMDELRSARSRRETYVGTWLPEPLITDPAPDPEKQVETADSLSITFLILLATLSPQQRATVGDLRSLLERRA